MLAKMWPSLGPRSSPLWDLAFHSRFRSDSLSSHTQTLGNSLFFLGISTAFVFTHASKRCVPQQCPGGRSTAQPCCCCCCCGPFAGHRAPCAGWTCPRRASTETSAKNCVSSFSHRSRILVQVSRALGVRTIIFFQNYCPENEKFTAGFIECVDCSRAPNGDGQTSGACCGSGSQAGGVDSQRGNGGYKKNFGHPSPRSP